jgi:hypothetical protein
MKRPQRKVARSFALPKAGISNTEKVTQVQRERARRLKGRQFELTGKTTLRALDYLDEACHNMLVSHPSRSKPFTAPVVRILELAELLDVSYQTLWRWTNKTELLAPPIYTEAQGKGYGVYHLEEARVIISVVGQHLCEFKYYRKDHMGTIARLAEQLDAVRVNLPTEGEDHHGTKTPSHRKIARPRRVKRRPRKG